MKWTLTDISKIVPGQLTTGPGSQGFELVSFDTRNLVFPSSTLFLALPGNRRDGHDYVADAYNKGVRSFIVSKNIDFPKYADAAFLMVENVLKSVQIWSKYHRRQIHFPVIGITGSNGKTMVKEWLSEILSAQYKVVKSPKSYNSQLGVPLSVLLSDDTHDLGVFEAGISHTDEMCTLSDIIHCHYGILTNIGDAHDAGFKNRKEKIEEKLKLFQSAIWLIYKSDDPEMEKMIDSHLPGIKKLHWTTNGNTDALYQIKVTPGPARSGIDISGPDGTYKFHCFFRGYSNIENICHSIIAALALGLMPDAIQEKINQLQPLPLRSEILFGKDDNLIINDSYNFDIFSLNSALEFLDKQAGDKEKVLIVSDIKQQKTEGIYHLIAKLIKKHKISKVFGVGNEIGILQDLIEDSIAFHQFESTHSLSNYLQVNPIRHKAILIKGAREFALENLSKSLLEKKHQTSLEINLSALDHNISEYSKFLHKKTKLLAVIKASGYGSGSDQLARKLESLKVDYLAVAYIDEGIFLRKSGISLPIIVLNPDSRELDSLIDNKLEPEIYSLDQLASYLEKDYKIEQIPGFHIKLDTGMHRLGFEASEIQELGERIAKNGIQVKSVFSHISASEVAEKDMESTAQAESFLKMYETLCSVIGYHPIRHLLNSSGIVRFPDYQFEMVRLGIGMYGIDPSRIIQDRLKKVHRLTSWVSQVKEVEAGQSVGYGRHFYLKDKKNIATVGIGYADGLLCAFGNGNVTFFVNGNTYPTIGNICMDMCMIDLGPDQTCLANTEVEIFGDHIDINDLARGANTIPYEILCGISGRVKRIYTED